MYLAEKIDEVEKKPESYNAAIFAAITLAHIYVLFVLPLFLLPVSIYYAVTITPFLFMHSTQWGLIHEAIHKNLSKNRDANEYGGRMLAVMLGVSFHILRFGHLIHHKLNRQWQSEIVPKASFREKASYYFNLLCGLYITEFVSSVMIAIFSRRVFLGIVKHAKLIGNDDVYMQGERFFYVKENAKYARIDMAFVAALYIPAFMAYGSAAWLLGLFIASRALMISFIDNLYHYGTEMDSAGKNLHANKWLAAIMLNSNYHGVHHKSPHVSWLNLPHHHKKLNMSYDGRFAEHAWLQLHGPIENQQKPAENLTFN